MRPDAPIEQQLRELALRREVPGSPVLSAYVRSPSDLRRMIRETAARLPRDRREAFGADAARAWHHVLEHPGSAPTVVLFVDASERFFWARGFQVPLAPRLRWEPTPYLRPLLDALRPAGGARPVLPNGGPP